MTDTTLRTGHIMNQRYERLGVLGRGGQGIVYRAQDRWMHRQVAIKVLSSKAARDPQTAERLIREQQALSALKGTAAVEVLDIYRGEGGELCLVMELLTGTDLDEHLYRLDERRERLTLQKIAEIFAPIVDTLEVAHNVGILHRDLKPANVFLLEGGGTRLLDFGMARLKKAAPLTAAGTVMGSPSFMAPEAWRGQSELVDHRADVYSLGVILFRVLAGELPFSGESLRDKFVGSTTAERPKLSAKRPDLPRAADEWVATALAIDRSERFQNVRALWSAFQSALNINPPGLRESLWAAAKGTVRKLASFAVPPPPAEPAVRKSEPSFGREALAKSVMHPEESTLEITAPNLTPPSPNTSSPDTAKTDTAFGAGAPNTTKTNASAPNLTNPNTSSPNTAFGAGAPNTTKTEAPNTTKTNASAPNLTNPNTSSPNTAFGAGAPNTAKTDTAFGAGAPNATKTEAPNATKTNAGAPNLTNPNTSSPNTAFGAGAPNATKTETTLELSDADIVASEKNPRPRR